MLGFQCPINPLNFIKIVGEIFGKIEFFLMWTTLNFRGRWKLKKQLEILARDLDIEFVRDRLIGLGSTVGDGHTARQRDGPTDRHTQTVFLKHFFRMLEWFKIEIQQKNRSRFFYDCNTSFTSNVARKKERERERERESEWMGLQMQCEVLLFNKICKISNLLKIFIHKINYRYKNYGKKLFKKWNRLSLIYSVDMEQARYFFHISQNKIPVPISNYFGVSFQAAHRTIARNIDHFFST